MKEVVLNLAQNKDRCKTDFPEIMKPGHCLQNAFLKSKERKILGGIESLVIGLPETSNGYDFPLSFDHTTMQHCGEGGQT